MLSVPGAKVVRGFSFFGDSYVCAVRGRHGPVLGAHARAGVPQPGAVAPRRGDLLDRADATGVGWIYQYALVDRSGTQDIRSCAPCRTGSSSSS